MGEADKKGNKKERRFSQEQYDKLMQCSEAEKTKKEKVEGGLWRNEWQYKLLKVCATDDEGIEKWNEWRKRNPEEEILLEGVNLAGRCLKGIKLNKDEIGGFGGEVHLERAHLVSAILEDAHLEKAHLTGADLGHANLKGAQLYGAHLENAELHNAHLENADLTVSHLEGAKLTYAHLENARLPNANLKGANLTEAHLQNARFHRANLQNAIFLSADMRGADLSEAHFEGANLQGCHLEGTYLSCTHLEGANLHLVYVDGSTLIWGCSVDRYCKGKSFTDFSGVGLDRVRIDPGTKQLLEYNVRRKNWEEWYKKRRFWHVLIRIFWWISDYGIDASRIAKVFFAFAMFFAIFYYVFGAVDYYVLGVEDYPGIVNNLFVDEQGPIEWWLVPLRSIYFSIVTMTTLGFGDMYANSHSYWWGWLGYLLLMVQVALGYVLLGALVTRFAVLFTAGGPAGKFAEK